LTALGIAGVEDIGSDQLATLRGLITAIKDGDTTVDHAFGGAEPAGVGKPRVAAPKAKPQTEAAPSA
jgi:hypothetical protein